MGGNLKATNKKKSDYEVTKNRNQSDGERSLKAIKPDRSWSE